MHSYNYTAVPPVIQHSSPYDSKSRSDAPHQGRHGQTDLCCPRFQIARGQFVRGQFGSGTRGNHLLCPRVNEKDGNDWCQMPPLPNSWKVRFHRDGNQCCPATGFSVAGFLYLLYFCRRYNDSWTFLIHGTGVDDLGKYIPSHRNVIYLVKTNFNPLGSSCHLQPPSCINSY